MTWHEIIRRFDKHYFQATCNGCGISTPPYDSKSETKKEAKADGWGFKGKDNALCPKCKVSEKCCECGRKHLGSKVPEIVSGTLVCPWCIAKQDDIDHPDDDMTDDEYLKFMEEMGVKLDDWKRQCPTCKGTGTSGHQWCAECNGKGVVK